MSATHWFPILKQLTIVFHPAQSRSSSAPTCSTFTRSAAASPTARCGSPPPLWMTALWRPCSSASSPSESCISGRAKRKGRSSRHPTIHHLYPKRKMGIQSDERAMRTKVTFFFYWCSSLSCKCLYIYRNVHSKTAQ